MSRYTEKAKQATRGSIVMEGRSKISTDEIIARYPDGITINQFDMLNGKNGRYVVCCFNQDPQAFFNGGKVLTQIFESFIADFKTAENTDADAIELCQNDFAAAGGLKVKLSTGRTKAGNRVTLVDVLD